MNNFFSMDKRKNNLIWFYPKICKFQDNKDFVKTLDEICNKKENDSSLLLYIHIPFCASFCSYCACFKENFYTYNFEERKKFVECIVKEIQNNFSKDFFQNKSVDYILFGGGSPSILETPLLEMIFKAIHTYCNLDHLKGISFEGNVMSLNDYEKLCMLKENGVNRVSFGIQTFNSDIRKKLNIKAPIDDIYACSELIRNVGIQNMNTDLIYNLPDETNEILNNDLRIITEEIKPSFIQTYRFNLFANTHLEKQVKHHYFDIIPSKEREMEMYKIIDNYLNGEGYNNQIFINMYSKLKGKVDTGIELSIGNNRLYGSNMLGIGPGAMSYLSGYNYRNYCSVKEYIKQMESLNHAIEIGHYIPKIELEHRVMVMFPNFMHIKEDDIPDNQEIKEKVERLIENGYIKKNNDELVLTDEGKLWAADISAYFYSDLEKHRAQTSYLNSLRYMKNPFNQDDMNV